MRRRFISGICIFIFKHSAEGQSFEEPGSTKIVGPGEAPPGAFPWMAALLIDGKSFCGGSLIDQYHILTAVSYRKSGLFQGNDVMQ
jgi:secreted trypsin-like serine protease